jgi:hypothetical protein
MTFGPLAPVVGDAASQQPNKTLLDLPFKFEGAAGCKDANCHGSPTPKPPPKPAGNEYLTWSEGKAGGEPDRHSKAYKTLQKDESKKIATALKIADATKSDLCVNCHALNVPKDKQMAKFNIEEGVTCAACHGPSEKWDQPHRQEGVGANALRKAAGYTVLDALDMPYGPESPEHKKLLTDVGLYDTRPILARAAKCVSCHLSIDATLIQAGHPQPTFELAYYTDTEPPHWREPGGFWGTKVWAAGQVTCLKDAMKQLADRATGNAPAPSVKAAADQALSHLLVFKNLVGGPSLDVLTKAAADIKAGGDNAKIAAAAKSVMAEADKLAPVVGGMKPDEATTAGLIAKISADATVATDAGIRGGEQQALALSSLFAAYAKGKGVKNDAVNKSINEDLLGTLDPAAFKPDTYGAALKAAAGKIAAVVPPTSTVAAPLQAK